MWGLHMGTLTAPHLLHASSRHEDPVEVVEGAAPDVRGTFHPLLRHARTPGSLTWSTRLANVDPGGPEPAREFERERQAKRTRGR